MRVILNPNVVDDITNLINLHGRTNIKHISLTPSEAAELYPILYPATPVFGNLLQSAKEAMCAAIHGINYMGVKLQVAGY